MSSAALLVFQHACRTIAEHPLLRAIDWYADCAGQPSSCSLLIDFAPQGPGFPHMEFDWKDTPVEVIAIAEYANALNYQRHLVADTTRKLSFGMKALAESPVADHEGLLAIEYHAEGYFVRAGALGEQVIRLVAGALKLSNADEARIDQLARSVGEAMPAIAEQIHTLQQALRAVKPRRNEAAHEATFSDERLTGLRGILSPSAAFGIEPWKQHLDVVERYRTAFLEGAAEEMAEIASHVCSLFAPVASVIEEYSQAELTRQRTIRESQFHQHCESLNQAIH